MTYSEKLSIALAKAVQDNPQEPFSRFVGEVAKFADKNAGAIEATQTRLGIKENNAALYGLELMAGKGGLELRFYILLDGSAYFDNLPALLQSEIEKRKLKLSDVVLKTMGKVLSLERYFDGEPLSFAFLDAICANIGIESNVTFAVKNLPNHGKESAPGDKKRGSKGRKES